MGVRRRPKSFDRGNGPASSGEAAAGSEGSGFAAIAKYGVGEPDPVTGIYRVYEVPAEVTNPKVSILDLVEDWHLVVSDFAQLYSIRLATVDMTWREFVVLLTGLLAVNDSRLFQRATKKWEAEDGGGDERRLDRRVPPA